MSDNNTFKDFVPEGEDAGAITKDGFQDFVPDPQPQPQVMEETPEDPRTDNIPTPDEAPVLGYELPVVEEPVAEIVPEPVVEAQPELVVEEPVVTVPPLEPQLEEVVG